MYGTIARLRIAPEKVDEVRALALGSDGVPGEVAHYIFRTDADPTEFYAVAIFESRDAYWTNAQSPEQHERYLALRALLAEDPEWHDGEVVDAFHRESAGRQE